MVAKIMRKIYTILSTILIFCLFSIKTYANTVYSNTLNLFESRLTYLSQTTPQTNVVNCSGNRCENNINGLVSLDSLALVFNPLENQVTEHAIFNGYISIQNLVPVGAGQAQEMPSISSIGFKSSDHTTPMGVCEIKSINSNTSTMGSIGQTTDSSTGVTYNIYQSTTNFTVDCYLGDTRLQSIYNYDLQFYFNNGQGLNGARFNVISQLNYYYASYDGEYNNNLELIRQAILGIQVGGGASSSDISQQTQDIINNNNTNTQQSIESQQVCDYIDKSDGIINGYLNVNGEISATPANTVTDYYKIDNGTVLKIVQKRNTTNYMCTYDLNKTLLECLDTSQFQIGIINLNTNVKYVRFTIRIDENKPQFEICINGNQAIDDSLNSVNNSITDVNDTLNDSNTSDASVTFEEFMESFDQSDYGFTDFVKLPITILQTINSATCAPLSLPIPFLNNRTIDLPCYQPYYVQYYGTVYYLTQTVYHAIIGYYCVYTLYRIIQDLLDPNNDKISIMDL